MKSGSKGICAGCFGLAIGLVWGIWCFIAGLFFHGGITMVGAMGSMYIGYSETLMGSFIGGLWGLLHGFIAGFLVALFYNLLCKCCKCRCCKGCCSCGNKDCDGKNCCNK
ncbi:MAG: hypothetical protein K2Q33_03745 [Gammaproteobacteria bacterium]|nr:hypothetical protein [Gammaproteobacteria bacterium]